MYKASSQLQHVLLLTRTSREDQYLHRSLGGKTIVNWPPPALSVNGLFTEADGIMAWVGAGAESDAGHTPLSF